MKKKKKQKTETIMFPIRFSFYYDDMMLRNDLPRLVKLFGVLLLLFLQKDNVCVNGPSLYMINSACLDIWIHFFFHLNIRLLGNENKLSAHGVN